MTSIQGIYIALYGRPADPAGLAYYTDVTNNGEDLSSIGDLSSVPEYQDRFADMSSEEIVTSIYESLFERAPDAEGLAFYVSLLEESSANINRIAIDILNGAQNEDLATINAKIAAADLFTMHLDTDAEVAAYQGNDAAEIGRQFIDSVDADDEGTGEEADAYILQLFPDEGQAPGEQPSTGGGGGGSSAPSDEAGYRSGDVLLLDGRSLEGVYDIDDYDWNYDAVSAAFADGSPGNTVLIQSEELIDDFGVDFVGEIVSFVLPSFEGWNADKMFLNVPGDSSTITGTGDNDVALVLNGNEFTNTITGGRGQDVLVAVGLDFVEPESRSVLVSEEGSHILDGGRDDDVVISVGGTNNILSGGYGNDLLASIGASIDSISGGSGNDIIFAGADGGQSYYGEHFFSADAAGNFDVPVEVAEVEYIGDYYEVEPRSESQNQITYLGQLANGDRILRVNNGEDTEVSWTVSGDNGFEQEVHIGADRAVIINVGSTPGVFSVPGKTGTATANADKPLELHAKASFEEGDTVDGGSGSDMFVYLPEGDLGDEDFGVPFIGVEILSNGADTILGFNAEEDSIALIVDGVEVGQPTFDLSDNDGNGFASFALAAVEANKADKQFFFAADVAGDGYLFVDDNDDGQIDFSIKLDGLTELGDFSKGNILLLDVSDLADAAMPVGIPFGEPMLL